MTDLKGAMRRTVSNSVAVRADLAPMQSKMDYARVLAASGLLPAQYRGKPENLLWAVEFGEMVGLSPMAAITSVHLIDGKPSASAQLIAALIRKAGHKLRVTGDSERAVAQIVRRDDPDYVFRAEWTRQRAQAAGLWGKGNWSKYPGNMLKARAITEVGRDACSDVLLGLGYAAEELDEDFGGDVFVVDAEPAPQVDTQTGEIADPDEWPEPAPIPNGETMQDES